MALQLIANTVAKACAQIVIADTSNVAVSDTEMIGVSNLIGGPRHLRLVQNGSTNLRKVQYVDTNGGLDATHCVVVDLTDNPALPLFAIEYFSAYPSSSTTAYTIAGVPTCTGPKSSDFVYSLGDITNKQAFSVTFGTGVQKKLRQVYFGKAVEFTQVENTSAPITWQPVPLTDSPVRFAESFYHLSAIASFTVTEVTQATLDAYFALDKDQPVFFYDDATLSAGVGAFIDEQLWHCIILESQVTINFDDIYSISFTLGILRYW